MTDALWSSSYKVDRLGVVMAPEPGNIQEEDGVLNPAGATGRDGSYYLFPRLVGRGNFSRVGIARVHQHSDGAPSLIERVGIALDPSTPYELISSGIGGCEDPRVTYLSCVDRYVMTYTALGPDGPHVALASSHDLLTWSRCGLADFAPEMGVDFNRYFNKDAIILPEPVRGPDGQLALAMLHRPVYEACIDPIALTCDVIPAPDGVTDNRPSMWLSYTPLKDMDWIDGRSKAHFTHHKLIAAPSHRWEDYRIGGGTVPIRVPEGWLTFYHGVELFENGNRCYQAGIMVLDHDDPSIVLERTSQPTFGPETPEELVGVVSNVCFPTAVDVRGTGIDVYYGAADSVICCAHLTPNAATGELDNEGSQDIEDVA